MLSQIFSATKHYSRLHTPCLARSLGTAVRAPARAIVAYNSPDGHTLDWRLEDIEVNTTLGPHELLIETQAVGICHTDVAFGAKIPHPKVFGHEGAAIVKEIGSSVTAAKPGDPVLLSVNYCGQCHTCTHDDMAYCENSFNVNFDDWAKDKPVFYSKSGESIEGRFFGQSTFSSVSVASENSVVNAKNFGLTESEFHKLSPLGCGIQTGAGATYIEAATKPGQTVAVYGLGGVGFAAIMGARQAGASKIIAVDINDNKLTMAKEFGATHTIKAGDDAEVHAKIMEITGRGTDVGFECIGGARFIENAISNSAVRGRVLYVGVPKDPLDQIKVPLLPFLFQGGRLQAVIEGGANPQQFIPQMVQWYKDGQFPVDKLVHLYKLDQYQTALDDMKKGKTIKPVLVF